MAKIRFLHLSDLHIGDSHQRGLISQTKKILFDDIDYIFTKIETLDVVFFTGDLVQKGSREEFYLLEEFLHDLWKLFEKHNQNPYLLCVPGNHDLERLNNENDPIQIVMTNWINEKIKEDHFWIKPNLYHDFIIERFKNYTEWYAKTDIRKPDKIIEGYLPGDFYCTMKLHDASLGIVGLNSSFLQLYGGNTKQKLGVYNKQLNHLFGEKYHDWLKSQSLSILLTHHSPEWFEPASFDEFNQEIYTNDSYIEHLCGHMHEPLSASTSINGFPAKRLFISPSVFGLEYFGEKSRVKRIHGYSAGIYNIESEQIVKTLWPRISIQTKLGVIKISQNEEFNLDKNSSSLSEVIGEPQLISEKIGSSETNSTLHLSDNQEDNLFGAGTIIDKGLARTLYKEVYSHMNIRLKERNIAIKNLQDKKYCWIISQFGLGQDEFIGTILNGVSINPGNCFCVNCGEVSSIEELIEAFNSTFSQNVTKFFNVLNVLDRPLLVLSNLTEDLVKNAGNLNEFIQTIFDFSPNVKVIIGSEISPDSRIFDYLKLFPLDKPAVKQYIEHSNELNSSFTFIEYEKIHRLSSGIPMYLDKVIEQLAFRSLSELGDMEFEISSNDDIDKYLPKTFKNELDIIRTEDSKKSNRRFMLLSVLSLLHNGETFDRIRRYDSTMPFHFDDISYLLKSKMIETVHVNSIFKDERNDGEVIKIIKVSRVIRDHISSLLLDNEKNEIYKQACNLYLGNNWRNSIKLIQPKDVELDVIVHQNIQITLRFILSYNIEKGDDLEINRMTRTAISLIEYFTNRGAYKDAISLTEEVLLLIKNITFENSETTRVYLMKRLGQNLRMTSIHNRSIEILKSICDDKANSLNKNDRNEIMLSIAYAYDTLKKKEEAVYYANLIKKSEKNKDSQIFLSAEYVITKFFSDNTKKIKKLNTLKNKCIKHGHTQLKANIILSISRIKRDKSQIKELDKIISESKDSTYNKIRALVAKADIILSTKQIEEITSEDLLGLNISYSYSFYQRLQTLLNMCHRLAWQFWSEQKRFDQLLNLFRYSSFVWRLCGGFEEEKKYIDELHSNREFIEWFKSNKFGVNSTYYEQRIFALYNNGTSNSLLN